MDEQLKTFVARHFQNDRQRPLSIQSMMKYFAVKTEILVMLI